MSVNTQNTSTASNNLQLRPAVHRVGVPSPTQPATDPVAQATPRDPRCRWATTSEVEAIKTRAEAALLEIAKIEVDAVQPHHCESLAQVRVALVRTILDAESILVR